MNFVNYKNGNYVVYFDLDSGDKIRNTHESIFKPAFAENCDVTITDYCDGGCRFCYAGCSKEGKHGHLNASFLETLHPYTELAINGNDLSHPDLEDFLRRMKDRHVIVNMTVNQIHFERHFERIQKLQKEKLINGIGLSLGSVSDELINKIKNCTNVILHVINGILNKEEAEKLYDKDLDILILGYKTTGRGQNFLDTNFKDIEKNQQWMQENLSFLFKKFKTVEFDNLALEQLKVQKIVDSATWNSHYMGNDGDFTFFINLVDGYFAKNSTAEKHYDLLNSVDEMFNVIKKEKT